MGRHRKLPEQSQFNYWTFVDFGKPEKWIVRCVCGTEREVRSEYVKQGKSKSCGCKKAEMISDAKTGVAINVKHGMTGTRPYYRWRNMMRRCYSPEHHKYVHYGARGIRVCDSWHDFANYYADVGDPPEPGLTLDRVNNDGNYEPGNVRWATVHEQLANRRNTKTRKEYVGPNLTPIQNTS